MNKIINRRQSICGVVWIIVLCAIFSLWPLRLIKETVISDSNRQMVMESEAVTPDYEIQQMFIAQYDRLKNIDIYFTDGNIGEVFKFRLYDARMNVIMDQAIETNGMKSIPGFCTVQVNIDAEVGMEYYFLIQGINAPFRVAYENTEDSGNIYNGTLYYDNVEDTEHCMIAAYEYEVPLRKGKTLLCIVLLMLAGTLVTYLSGRYYDRRPEKNTLVTVEQTMKAVCNPLIVVSGAAALIAVWPCRLFTPDTAGIILYEVGIIVAAAILLYAVNHNRTGIATDRTLLHVLKENWQSYMQSAFFAGAAWACCNYMNALFEMQHTVAYRQMLVFLALAVIVTYKRKDIFNLVNLIYTAAAVIIGLRYYSVSAVNMENPDELSMLALKLTVCVGILAGLVVIGTIRLLVRRQVRDISVWYSLFAAVFFVSIIWYRNTRGWPIYLVCSFGLFYLNMAAWDKKEFLLRNICNGVLLHFAAMVVYCLLHRPYMFFIYSRYQFIFHTVTIAGVYLALVVTVALVKFMDAYRRQQRLAYVYKELVILGISSVYLILTMCRTGYLAILVMAMVIIPAVCFSLRHRLRSMLQSIGMIILSVVICFPMTFTAQRIVPAVAARPILHEIEWLPDEIMHGRYMDSYYYMTIQRFIQTFEIKVLGVPEEDSLQAKFVYSDSSADNSEILLESGEEAIERNKENKKIRFAIESESYSNGRMETFRLYYANLNKTGHDEMWLLDSKGNAAGHAHNIYLQVAYDHGIYVGILFIIFAIGTLVQAVIYYHRRKEDRMCAGLPLAVLILFAVAGLTEWIFHPCNPTTCCLLVAIMPLLFDRPRNA